jgi:hypothetical protein
MNQKARRKAGASVPSLPFKRKRDAARIFGQEENDD